jgi:hypothetical protein
MRNVLCGTSLALLLVGCASVEVPLAKTTWVETVRKQIASANETNYVYVAVCDKSEAKMVEKLAFQQGKQTQTVQRNGQMTECVFMFGPEQYFKSSVIPVTDHHQ